MAKYCPECADTLSPPGYRCTCGWRASGSRTPGMGREPDVPHWPETCGVEGCDEHTTIAILQVRDDLHRVRTGAFSDFGYVKGDGWYLRKPFQFVRWITRCATHYQNDVDRYPRSNTKRRDNAA